MNEQPTPTQPRKRRGIVIGTLVGLVLAGGGLSVAAAAQSGPTTKAPGSQQQEAGEQPDASYTSSITANEAPEGKEGSQADEAAADKTESDALAKLATVTPAQAADAATSAFPGTAATPELSNEDGNVVYDVAVAAPDGTITEVVVDAGNAKVLVHEVDDDHDANEAPEQGETPDAPATTAPASTPGGVAGN